MTQYRLVPAEPTPEMLDAAPQPEQEPVEFCTDYHCTGDCGKHGFGVQHAHLAPDQGAEIERLKAENTRLQIALANRSVSAKEASALYALKEERLQAQEAELMCDTLREQVRVLSEALSNLKTAVEDEGVPCMGNLLRAAGVALAAVKGEQA